MSYVNVKFGSEARDKVIEGVKLATNAISTTYGPNGSNVLYRNGGLLRSTKDGASVIQVVNDPDPYVQMGIDVIKEASINTAKSVGDGSTTVAVLVNAIIDNYKHCDKPIQRTRELRTLCDQAIKYLSELKKEISSKEDLVKVATLSANNDPVIGEIIAEAFNKVGKDGLVSFQESEEVKDRIEYSEGFKIESGYESPYFINTSKNECILEDVMIYISDVKLDETKEMHDLAGKAYKEGKGLLLIAPEFDSGLTIFLNRNLFNPDGTPRLKSCMVNSPNFGVFRDTMLSDMRALFGESSHCDKVVVTKDSTTFIGYESDKTAIDTKIKSIREIIQENSLPEIEMSFHKKRLANFTSGMATIYVGGYSKVEMRERYDRFEDAIMATQCALEGGVLPGGGTALNEVAKKFNNVTFINVLTTPIKALDTDIKTIEQAYNNNVIEPYFVVKATLENAVAVASTILTTNCAILNV